MSSLAIVSAFVVIGSAILITLDAGKIGIAGPNDPAVMDGKSNSPHLMGNRYRFAMADFFPAYMYWRSKVGAKNYLLIATLGMLAFMGSVFGISGAIEKKEQEVLQTLSSFGGELNSLGEIE